MNFFSLQTVKAVYRILQIYFSLHAALLFSEPPRRIPPQLYQAFTLDGQIPVVFSYHNESRTSDQALIYEYEVVEQLKEKALRREINYYGLTDQYLYAALDLYHSYIQGKRVAIMGSNVPWYEAVILAYGGSPVIIEYNKIVSQHPSIQAMTVAEYEESLEQFDAILSISSYEHDGLGRYGDPIQPDGDLQAMEKTKKMLKPKGILFLAVPIGRDCLVWNAHRIYGEKRLPMLLTGWKVLDTFGFQKWDLHREGFEQPIFVLEQRDSG